MKTEACRVFWTSLPNVIRYDSKAEYHQNRSL